MKRAITLMLSVVMVGMLFVGCTQEDKSSSQQTTSSTVSTEISVVDMQGNQVTLKEPAKKIVVLTPGDCEILYAIGAGERVIGRGEYCNYPQEAIAVTSVESGAETNVEQLLALQPDLVIMGTMAQSTDTIQALKNAGATVILTEAPTIETTYQAIALLGEATGQTKEATKLVEQMKNEFSVLEKKVPQGEKKTVYFEVSPLQWGLWTSGNGTFMTEIAQLLGVENAFSDVSGWTEVSQEQILQRNPDYIVTNTVGPIDGMTPEQEILSRKGWQELKAVSNQKVFATDPDSISRSGPRLVEAAQLLYKFFYE